MRLRLIAGALAAAAATALIPQSASAVHRLIACSEEFDPVCQVVFDVERRLCSDPFSCTTR